VVLTLVIADLDDTDPVFANQADWNFEVDETSNDVWDEFVEIDLSQKILVADADDQPDYFEVALT
jgi:hypothetical protein